MISAFIIENQMAALFARQQKLDRDFLTSAKGGINATARHREDCQIINSFTSKPPRFNRLEGYRNCWTEISLVLNRTVIQQQNGPTPLKSRARKQRTSGSTKLAEVTEIVGWPHDETFTRVAATLIGEQHGRDLQEQISCRSTRKRQRSASTRPHRQEDDTRVLTVTALLRSKKHSPAAIRHIRAKADVSQAVSAAHVKATVGVVSKWERGEKSPSGSAAKLPTRASIHGIEAIAPRLTGKQRWRRSTIGHGRVGGAVCGITVPGTTLDEMARFHYVSRI